MKQSSKNVETKKERNEKASDDESDVDCKKNVESFIASLKSGTFFEGKKLVKIDHDLRKENRYARIVWINILMARGVHKSISNGKDMKTIHHRSITNANKTYYKRVYFLIDKCYVMAYYPSCILYNIVKNSTIFKMILNYCSSLNDIRFEDLKVNLNTKSVYIYLYLKKT